MIQHLHITNYALISDLDISFYAGLNIITGETGAGKSIILGALGLLLGDRADMRAIRDAKRKSVIEATFGTAGFEHLREVFTANDVDWYDDTCILRRELTPNGRSRAFVNDTPVTLQQLREIAIRLVDIHSQHQNLLLADHDYQLSIIDCLAGNGELLEQYAAAYKTYREALKRYTDKSDAIARNSADAEFMTFQLEQLREMDLQPGEQAALEHERDMLSNMAQIKDCLSGAIDILAERQGDVLTSLSQVSDYLSQLSHVLPDAEALLQRLESARLEVQDIGETLTGYDSDLNADPAQLQFIEERLSRIYTLESKHHVDTSDQLIELRDRLASQLVDIENADEALSQLKDEAKNAKRAAKKLAAELSQRRREQATAFADELRQRAMPLGMSNLRCEITFEQTKLSPTGMDAVDFMFAFNKNQPLMSVGNTASGGEISRLILSIKLVVAEKMQLPTIIFDEVDTGVSGDIALRMGALMARISQRSQVIAITHLPQVAAQGATHFKVYKEDDDASTNTRIKLLTPQQRIAELALMLSGNADDPAARATAQTLLGDKGENT